MEKSTIRLRTSLLALGLGACLVAGCGEDGPVARAGGGVSVAADAEDPIVFADVPDFGLTSQLGEPVTRESLLGRPYAVAAVFTTCVGPCPRISSEMKRLQAELKGTDALLVSISVDPEADSPEVLRKYAEGFGADPERWLFLTGEEELVYELVREGFKIGVARAGEEEVRVGFQVTHGTQIAAVDKRGRIRGWYDSQTDEGVGRLKERMRFLATEDLP